MWIEVISCASGAGKRDMFDFNVSHSACASANAMQPAVVTNATARTHTAQNNFVRHGRRDVCASSSRVGNLSASVAIPASTPFESVHFIRTSYSSDKHSIPPFFSRVRRHRHMTHFLLAPFAILALVLPKSSIPWVRFPDPPPTDPSLSCHLATDDNATWMCAPDVLLTEDVNADDSY